MGSHFIARALYVLLGFESENSKTSIFIIFGANPCSNPSDYPCTSLSKCQFIDTDLLLLFGFEQGLAPKMMKMEV